MSRWPDGQSFLKPLYLAEDDQITAGRAGGRGRGRHTIAGAPSCRLWGGVSWAAAGGTVCRDLQYVFFWRSASWSWESLLWDLPMMVWERDGGLGRTWGLYWSEAVHDLIYISLQNARTPRVMAYKYTDPFRSSPTIHMCYSSGSIDQALNPCPMCKVYPHTKCVPPLHIPRLLTRTRCPHIRKTCTNRGAHPRMDVLYLTNAEGLSSLVQMKHPLIHL